MQALQPFLPKKGNYQDLASYKKATVIYDLTFYFANRFLYKGDRTIDQMVQAARSGKQNIAEGSAAASTSSETELKLTNVARASMKELLVDYALKTRSFCRTHNDSADFMNDIDRRSDETLANITITLIHQFDNIIGKYIKHLEEVFVEEGGIRERMTAARLGFRKGQKSEIERLTHENEALRNYIAQLKARIEELEKGGKG